MEKIKVMTVFGTRPEAIKMAPLVRALEQGEHTESIVCVTAQHRQMLDQVLEIFQITPDYDLDIMEPRQTLATITEKSLHGLDTVLEEAKPDIVLVHGDTSTTFAGALAAFYHKIPVGYWCTGILRPPLRAHLRRFITRFRLAMLKRDFGPLTSIRPSRRK